MHKIHHLGMSGTVFTECGDNRSSIKFIQATDDDDKVTCGKCLEIMAANKLPDFNNEETV